jgi:predicted nuclease with RNAse H fold
LAAASIGASRRLARRHDRQQEIGLAELRVGDRAHAGCARTLFTRGAATGERGEHGDAVLVEALSHAGAHIAGRDDGDG